MTFRQKVEIMALELELSWFIPLPHFPGIGNQAMLTLKTPGNGLWDHLGFDTEIFIHLTFAHCHRTTPQTRVQGGK